MGETILEADDTQEILRELADLGTRRGVYKVVSFWMGSEPTPEGVDYALRHAVPDVSGGLKDYSTLETEKYRQEHEEFARLCSIIEEQTGSKIRGFKDVSDKRGDRNALPVGYLHNVSVRGSQQSEVKTWVFLTTKGERRGDYFAISIYSTKSFELTHSGTKYENLVLGFAPKGFYADTINSDTFLLAYPETYT